MHARPLHYTLRGIPSPRVSTGELDAEQHIPTGVSCESDAEADDTGCIPTAGWPDRLRQALSLDRFFGGR